MNEKLGFRRPDLDPPVHLTSHDIYTLLRSALEELDHQLATRILCSLKSEAGLEQTFTFLKKRFPNGPVPRDYILKLANTQDSRLPKSIKSDPRTLTERIRDKAIGQIYGKN